MKNFFNQGCMWGMLHNFPDKFCHITSPRNTHFQIKAAALGDDVNLFSPC